MDVVILAAVTTTAITASEDVTLFGLFCYYPAVAAAAATATESLAATVVATMAVAITTAAIGLSGFCLSPASAVEITTVAAK